MAKRHDSLVPIARDHYDGLLLAIRLQQGKQALERLWLHDPLWQANFVVEFYQKHLRRHFAAEEEALFPEVVTNIPACGQMIQELTHEHREFEAQIEAFRSPDPAALEERLAKFGAILEGHIRKEDRELFPMIEQNASVELLDRIAQNVRNYYPSAA